MKLTVIWMWRKALPSKPRSTVVVGSVAAEDIIWEETCFLKTGNEVHCTACSLLVILKNSCSKLHCQKGFDAILFSYQIATPTTPYPRPQALMKLTAPHKLDCKASQTWTPNPEIPHRFASKPRTVARGEASLQRMYLSIYIYLYLSIYLSIYIYI